MILFFLIIYLYKFIFTNTMFMGTLISISANSWLGMWIGLEMNLLSIIPLMNNSKNPVHTESSIKYFIVQAIASTLLVTSIILMMKTIVFINEYTLSIMTSTAMLTKMGAAPFHFWFPEVMEGLTWTNSMFLLTWQKIAPMVIMTYNPMGIKFMVIIIISSMMVGGILGLNQTSLRKIMAYSSINHIAWMLSAMMYNETIWWYYFLIYSLISINILVVFNQMNIFTLKQLIISANNNSLMKLFIIMNFLSLGGLPPFLGFFSKWMTIQIMIQNNMFMLTIIMIIMTMVPLYFYMRITFSTFLISGNEMNQSSKFEMHSTFLLGMNMISIMSLILSSIFFNLA